jgi:hypothetical protein
LLRKRRERRRARIEQERDALNAPAAARDVQRRAAGFIHKKRAAQRLSIAAHHGIRRTRTAAVEATPRCAEE